MVTAVVRTYDRYLINPVGNIRILPLIHTVSANAGFGRTGQYLYNYPSMQEQFIVESPVKFTGQGKLLLFYSIVHQSIINFVLNFISFTSRHHGLQSKKILTKFYFFSFRWCFSNRQYAIVSRI